MRAAIAFACSVVFALGLGISGMLQPAKVIGFLDVLGAWDPTLLGVMAGAIPVYAIAWMLRHGRASPFGSTVPAKASHALDRRLFLGATLFGVGWGLVGVCPGPAVANLAARAAFPLVALAAVVAGVAASFLVPARRSGAAVGAAPAAPQRARAGAGGSSTGDGP